jgi:hypothetical protein
LTKRSHFIAFTFLIFLLSSSFHKAFRYPETTLIIHFRVYIHGEPLLLNKKYANPFGEIFEISRFRFYAGKFAPVYSDTTLKTKISSAYHLVDFSDSSSAWIAFPVTAGTCNGIQFQLGIDSIDQNQGAQTGALDPVNGMFWTWNSGYQSLKIEGYSPVSSLPAHMIAYHIGGYRYPYNTVWKIKLFATNDEEFRITEDNQTVIDVPLELDYLFDGANPLHIKEIPGCTTAGELARKISENFIGTFIGLTISPKS